MIDYRILHEAIEYYKTRGFEHIESPWTVTKAVSGITKPPGVSDWAIEGKNKVLVASGEQSYLYLYLKGFLPKGRFVTVTPCFREEPFDLLHTKYFMKAEIIDTKDVSTRGLDLMVSQAYEFFAQQLGTKTNLNVVKIDESTFDIELCGYELGSYGIRSCSYLDWIYGTGVAEPRFSTLRRQVNGLSYDEDSTREVR